MGVTAPVPGPLGTIARHLATSPPDDRTHRRRRLASLAGVLALVLAIAPFVGGDGDDVVGVTTDAAATDVGVVRAAGLGDPSAVRELLSETTTTLVEATGASTSTTSTTEAAATSSSTAALPEAAEDDGAEEEADTSTTTSEAGSARALHTHSTSASEGPTTTEAPTTTTTAAPRRAPSTTAAPTTTTTAPEPEPEPSGSDTSDGGYAYDDPRSTQVWHDLAQCESGGNWSIDTGNGYYGGLQFSLPTWESVGGSGYPHEHPSTTQIELGRRLQARQGWGAWPHCSEKLGLR